MRLREVTFHLVVLLTLALSGLFGAMVVLMNVQPGFMGMAHFTERSHRVHDLSFGLLNAATVIGMLVQLRAPVRNMVGQLVALIPFATLLAATALTNAWVLSPPWLLVGVGAVLATMFHPAGDPLRAFRGAHADRLMLALVALAAAPLIAYAWTNIGLQRAGPTDHAMLGHYGYMAALSFTIIGAGLLAGVRPPGSRVSAWVAGGLAIALGITSLVYADVDSSLPTAWSLAAVAWGAVFIGQAERSRSRSA